MKYLFCGFVDSFATVVMFFFIGRSFHTENFKSKDQGLVGEWTIFWVKVWVSLEENIGEADSKVGPVNVEVFLARNIHFLASRAVYLDS